MIDAKIALHSIGPNGVELLTWILIYPRFIHAEFMTHRDFSRNASSSRAIPVKKSIEQIERNMAIPLVFRKNKAGMQAGEVLEDQDAARELWIEAGNKAVEYAKRMADMEIHKQYANRILEPYSHIAVIVSSTRWANFYALRHHGQAQPEIAALAELMWELHKASTPQKLEKGQWHLPLISDEEKAAAMAHPLPSGVGDPWEIAAYEAVWMPLIKQSTARCARVSYLNHEGKKPTPAEDYALYDRLLTSQPLHASPPEHPARAESDPELKSGNFHGWTQYRKLIQGEYITEFKGPLDEKPNS